MLTLEPWSVIFLHIKVLKLIFIYLRKCHNLLFFSDLWPVQSRPFGVALLFGGVDEKGPQLWVKIWNYKHKHAPVRPESSLCCFYEHRYHMDPSGTFVQCDARAIGSASEGAQSSLQEVYHKVSAEYLHYNEDISWAGSSCRIKKKSNFLWFLLCKQVYDTEGCHQIIPDYSEAGDGGEAECHQHWGLFPVQTFVRYDYDTPIDGWSVAETHTDTVHLSPL